MSQLLLALAATSTTATSTAGLGLQDAVDLATKAYTAGDWQLVFAGALMALVAAARQLNLLKLVPSKVVPWLAIGLACATSIGVGLYQGQGWLAITTTGLLVGLSAVGSWESIGRLIQAGSRKLGGSPEEVAAEKKGSE